ncbi:MAG: MarR family transcriptional regulator [Mycobacterium sp.]|nr:MarR family transcriptional regulator [Mycobacterium sp.]
MSTPDRSADSGVGPLSAYRDEVQARYGSGARYAAALHLMLAERHVVATITDVLRPHGLTRPQWSVLTTLHLAPADQIPLGRIATALEVHGTIITNAVYRLSDLGFAERVVGAHDRRSVLAAITAEGSRCADEIMTELSRRQFGLSRLAEKDVRGLGRILNSISPQD